MNDFDKVILEKIKKLYKKDKFKWTSELDIIGNIVYKSSYENIMLEIAKYTIDWTSLNLIVVVIDNREEEPYDQDLNGGIPRPPWLFSPRNYRTDFFLGMLSPLFLDIKKDISDLKDEKQISKAKLKEMNNKG